MYHINALWAEIFPALEVTFHLELITRCHTLTSANQKWLCDGHTAVLGCALGHTSGCIRVVHGASWCDLIARVT